MFIRSAISVCGTIEAILLQVLFAVITFPAGIHETPDSYCIPHFKFFDMVANIGHFTYYFMPWYEWIS
jgi:hypothetical protein